MELVPPIELRDETFICGRGTSEQVNFDFAGLRDAKQWIYSIISKQHFRLDRVEGRTVLTDLSFNGTFVNQKLVGKFHTYVLDNGDVISCGRADLHVFLYEENSSETYPAELMSRYIMTKTSLGRGGYGVVLLGKLRSNCQRQVAVKILDTTQLSRRFSRTVSKAKDVEKEVAIMLQIKHPNCVEFIDWIETENTAYIVMELVGGGELFDRIVDEKWNGMGFGEELCKFYGWQLLSAVEYLHDRGITHRDIKPENILCMTKEDYTLVKLADFGLAKGNEASTLKTYCGTPAYMAPEMIDNDRLPYNPKVDMWSLGVVLFTGISGYPPFSDDYTDMDLKSQIKTGGALSVCHFYNLVDTQRKLQRKVCAGYVSSLLNHWHYGTFC
ncbi:Ovarian-specific serine/threonine-protein kinase Lok [Trichostrongylus colubriformis]|uniref:Ovarian-specific serine/threonine-protein kinase Lok n=1 Tax=Trichostrongylus colubriformis TaxID=6319 RepID=A0AAN8FWI6_TRICO